MGKKNNMNFNVEFDGFNVIKGDKGDPGYTPVKGVDYFTDEEKDDLVNDIKDQINIPSKVSELENDSHYVKAEEGKGLSTNDFTNVLKNRLEHVENNAQKNVIETIKVNGEKQNVVDKSVNLNIVTPEAGKGLSTNDFTNALKNKLVNSENNAQENRIESLKINGEEQDITDKSVNLNVITPDKVDDTISANSENPIQNKVIKKYVDRVVADIVGLQIPIGTITPDKTSFIIPDDEDNPTEQFLDGDIHITSENISEELAAKVFEDARIFSSTNEFNNYILSDDAAAGQIVKVFDDETNEYQVYILQNSSSGLITKQINSDSSLSDISLQIQTEEIEGSEVAYLVMLDADDNEITRVQLPALGGGGSSANSTITIERVTQTPVILTTSEDLVISVNFSAVDGDGDYVDSTYVWKKDGRIIKTGSMINGLNSFNLTEYLTVGNQKFTLTVTDETGNVSSKSWTTTVADVRVSSDFNDVISYNVGRTVSFTYTPYGAFPKIAHFVLDGVEIGTANIGTVSGSELTYSIPTQEHGSHLLEVYTVATINDNVTLTSNSVYKDIVWIDPESDTPVISTIYRSDYYGTINVNQYDNFTIPYSVHDSSSDNPSVTLSVDGNVISELTLDTPSSTWNYRASEVGSKILTITCGETSVDISLNIVSIGIEISPVTANLEFDFNPYGRSNSSTNRLWTDDNNPEIQLSVSNNFDWKNGGYGVDEDGSSYFCIKAGTRATINYKLFGDNPAIYGSEFKIIFKTSDVRDVNATFLNCYSDDVGLVMKVHEAQISSSASMIANPYSEEDKICFDYNINPLDTQNIDATSIIMMYEDGVVTRPLVYDNNHRLYQYDSSDIIIGSDDCDVYIYRIRYYSNHLSNSNILKNYIADLSNSDEMITTYRRNQIYDDNSAITPEYLATVCPDLKIIKIDAPKFTNNKSETISDTTIECIHVNGDPVLDNWIARNAAHSGQGTTSNEYGVAGRNLDAKLNLDDTVITLGDGTVCDSGKVSLTRTSVPNNYFNVKVNIASSENVNNALLQKRYNDYLPYTTPAMKKDPKVKTTMEFVNCVVFIRENDPDLTTHREFNDTNWHFYAIGNIGDSKKTDKTRVNDPSDTREFVNEILDNTLSNSIFDTGVVNLIVEELPTTGDLFTDYYTINQDKTYTLHRYLNNEWVTVSTSIKEIQNGAVSIVSELPDSGIINIEYYIPDNDSYTVYSWNGTQFSEGISRDSIINRHMANSIAPEQWVVGNVKYDSLYADNFDGDSTNEFRYEHKNVSDSQHLLNMQVWRDMYEWVITSTDEEFINGVENWFIKEALLYFYLFTERYTMTDNRAKNTFWHWSKIYISESEATGDYADVAQYYTIDNEKAAINDGYRFDFWDYDNDTALGINNSGELKMPFGKEDIDYQTDNDPSSGYVFNGAESVIFRRVRLLLHSDLMSMYQDRDSAGAWDANNLISQFDNAQTQFPEELWRLDMERKYYRPYLGASVDGSIPKQSDRFLKTMLNGRKKYQRRQFERDQSIYIGSKYLASFIKDDQIMFRCNTPQGAVVSPDYTLEIVPYSTMYLSVKFGNTSETQIRAKAGETYTIDCPFDRMDDTAVLIYNASRIQALNDLSACYIHDNDFSKATKIRSLVIGNATVGYDNPFLTTLTIGNNDILEYLDVRNCSNLTGSINLSGCINLKELYASGTSLTGVLFAKNGRIEKVYLPETVTSLSMDTLNYITVFDMVDNILSNLIIRDSDFDSLSLVQDNLSTLRELTLTGINWDLRNSVDAIDLIDGIYSLPMSSLSGKIKVSTIKESEYNRFTSKWNGLEISYSTLIHQHIVSFVNYDGTPILDSQGNIYYQWIDEGGHAYDPVEEEEISTPLKPMTAQYTFTFSNWHMYVNGTISSQPYNFNNYIVQPITLISVFDEELRKYTVRWYTSNNNTALMTGTWNSANGERVLLHEETEVPYGTELVFDDFQKIKCIQPSSHAYVEAYNFIQWDKSTGYVSEDLDVYAIWQYAKVLKDADGKIILNDDMVNKKTLMDMSMAEVAIVCASGEATTYFENRDYIDFIMGHDYTFSNVEEDTLVPVGEELHLDGLTPIIPVDSQGNQIKLFSADAPSFTMAIDYQFTKDAKDYAPVNNKTLVSCFENPDNGNDGFALRYNSNKANVLWGDKNQNVTTTYNRDMLVVRHIKGSDELYIYAFNGADAGFGIYSKDIVTTTINRTTFTNIDAPLIFGGIAEYDSTTGTYKANTDSTYIGSGIIYWCKIWYGDLGDSVARKLASWTRDENRQEYYEVQLDSAGELFGSPYILSNSILKANASFVSSNLIRYAYWLNNTATNVGGWGGNPSNYIHSMHYFMQNKFYPAIPDNVRNLITQVKVPSIEGNRSTIVVNYDSYVYMPCIREVDGSGTSAYVNKPPYTLEGSIIPWFTTSARKACFADIVTLESSVLTNGNTKFTGTSEPIFGQNKGFYDENTNPNGVREFDIWLNGNTMYIYLSEETLRKKNIEPTIHLSKGSNFIGGWYSASNYWTRSPSYNDNNKNFIDILPSGAGNWVTGYWGVPGNYSKSIRPCFSFYSELVTE